MSVDIERLKELDLDYRGDVDPHDSAEEVMEMLPAIIAEMERLRRLEAAVLAHPRIAFESVALFEALDESLAALAKDAL